MPQLQPIRLESLDRACEGLLVAHFNKPNGYSFAPGQYMGLTLETDQGPVRHWLSHADAPLDEEIVVATRPSSSAFKQALARMEQGAEASVEGPFGKLAVPESARRILVLSGGVGISPFRSILRARDGQTRGPDTILINGNNLAACIPFKAELDAIATRNDWLTVVNVVLEPGRDWQGETGFITADTVRRYCPDVEDTVVMSAGPPAMVEAMGALLDQMGVSAEARVFERFAGY